MCRLDKQIDAYNLSHWPTTVDHWAVTVYRRLLELRQSPSAISPSLSVPRPVAAVDGRYYEPVHHNEPPKRPIVSATAKPVNLHPNHGHSHPARPASSGVILNPAGTSARLGEFLDTALLANTCTPCKEHSDCKDPLSYCISKVPCKHKACHHIKVLHKM